MKLRLFGKKKVGRSKLVDSSVVSEYDGKRHRPTPNMKQTTLKMILNTKATVDNMACVTV